MTDLMFIREEIKRYNERFHKGHAATKTKITYDICGNFCSVSIGNTVPGIIGYAKRNPKYDKLNIKTGLSIATFRALKRIDGK